MSLEGIPPGILALAATDPSAAAFVEEFKRQRALVVVPTLPAYVTTPIGRMMGVTPPSGAPHPTAVSAMTTIAKPDQKDKSPHPAARGVQRHAAAAVRAALAVKHHRRIMQRISADIATVASYPDTPLTESMPETMLKHLVSQMGRDPLNASLKLREVIGRKDYGDERLFDPDLKVRLLLLHSQYFLHCAEELKASNKLRQEDALYQSCMKKNTNNFTRMPTPKLDVKLKALLAKAVSPEAPLLMQEGGEDEDDAEM